MALCALRAAMVLSRNCCADFCRPLAKKVMSHSRDGPGVADRRCISHGGVESPPSVTLPHPKKVPDFQQPLLCLLCHCYGDMHFHEAPKLSSTPVRVFQSRSTIATVYSLMLGTDKVPQRNFVTKILPNVRVNFLARFSQNPGFTG